MLRNPSIKRLFCQIFLSVFCFGLILSSCHQPPVEENYSPFTELRDCFPVSRLMKQNMTIDFGSVASRKFLVSGWSPPEYDAGGFSFCWADREQAVVLLPLMRKSDILLQFKARPLPFPNLDKQVVTVLMNGEKLAVRALESDWFNYTLILPARVCKAGNNYLSFQFSQLQSPSSLGISRDVRQLAACFDYIRYQADTQDPALSPDFRSDCIISTTPSADSEDSLIMIPPDGEVSFQTLLPPKSRLSFSVVISEKTRSRALDSKLVYELSCQVPGQEKEHVFWRKKFSEMSSLFSLPSKNGWYISKVLHSDSLPVKSMEAQLHFRCYTLNNEVKGTIESGYSNSIIEGSWDYTTLPEPPVPEREIEQVFLLGLDGLTWDIVLPMMKDGKLPHLASVMDQGYASPLVTLVPTKSPMLWTTIATGKKSEKHGIVDYVSWDPQKKARIPVTVNLRKTKALWNIMTDLQSPVQVLGWWPSWPAEKVLGTMVSDRRGPDTPHQVFPEGLFSELQKNCQPDPFPSEQFFPEQPDLQRGRIGDYRLSSPEKQAIQNQLLRVQQRDSYYTNCAEYLLRKEKPRFFAIYLNGVDPVCHLFWKYRYPELYGLREEETQLFSKVIPGYYQYVDDMLGRLLHYTTDRTLIIIVSDHGFGSEFNRNFKVEINRFLELTGFLTRDPHNGQIDRITTMIERGPSIDASLDQRMIIRPDIMKDADKFAGLKARFSEIVSSLHSSVTGFNPFTLDWTQGQDYDFTIRVDYRPMIDEDLIIGDTTIPFNQIFPEDFVSGSHGWGPDGIVVMKGPGIKHHLDAGEDFRIRINSLNRKMSIMDVTPTILYLLGEPLAEDMDGRPYFAAMKNSFKEKMPISMVKSYDALGKPLSFDFKAIESSEDSSIREQLKSLGYIN